MFIIKILIFKIFLLNTSLAEWIEIPQFSNEEKVYKIPLRQDQFYKFTQKENQFFYTYQNITYKNLKGKQTATNKTGEYDFYKLKNNVKEEPTILKYFNKNETTDSLITKEKKENKQYLDKIFIANDIGLLNYLPVDILENVHCTLKSQPASNDGKIQFLKTFENTLISEIEVQLVASTIIARKKRGTDQYDHNYDYEHAAGFPSIEGALMAISFLTFAVYLVRLVMLLFRNMNNSASTTSATLLLGRRKKSVGKLDDDIRMILKDIHNFSSKFKKKI
ncbi:uncharacterized protein LOC122711643 [Apis laboriosa]|uniref:uncharacterized protein LOC122711643 n=1 Tax=Apis laboriosa TaxID=183418 RepID=UPI001CC69778|nr:uncharacterized protein LOC122711643 [Apis laboriosa]